MLSPTEECTDRESAGGNHLQARGKDARVTMERTRERRLNIEGRKLDAELDTAAPKPQGHVQAPVTRVGCAVLAHHLRAVAWPSKFRPHLSEKYDGMTNLSEFL